KGYGGGINFSFFSLCFFMARRHGYTKNGKRHEQRNEKEGPSQRDKKRRQEEKGWPGLIRLLCVCFHISSTCFFERWRRYQLFFSFFLSALDKKRRAGRNDYICFLGAETEDQRECPQHYTVFTLMKPACGR
ncbi:hypothetical protein, partial [Stenotrophomonas muris]|uniref:hypothetical protein n=1 Tax=Stenotrophomonas muris TaxID=2963283 RepID=UPI00300ECD95